MKSKWRNVMIIDWLMPEDWLILCSPAHLFIVVNNMIRFKIYDLGTSGSTTIWEKRQSFVLSHWSTFPALKEAQLIGNTSRKEYKNLSCVSSVVFLSTNRILKSNIVSTY